MKFIHKFLIKCDILSPQVQIRLKNNEKIKTYLGGLYSIFSIVILTVFTWLLGKDIIFKQRPILINLTDKTSYMPQLETNFSSIFFAFRIEYNNASVIKELLRSYSFSATIQTYTKHNTLTNTTSAAAYDVSLKIIDLVNCSHYKNSSFSTFISDSELNNFLCLDPNIEFNLGGIWGHDLSLVEIMVDYCQNLTNISNDCLPKEIIDLNMNSFYFSFYYFDTVINPTDFVYPVKIGVSNIYTLIDKNIFKNAEFYYRSVDILTDSGFFVESSKNVSTLQFDTMNIGISTNNNQPLLQFDYYLNNYRNILYRKYIKVQDVFAQLGGLIQLIVVFGDLALYYVRILKTNSRIMNSIFDFRKIDNEAFTYLTQKEVKLRKAFKPDVSDIREIGSIGINNFLGNRFDKSQLSRFDKTVRSLEINSFSFKNQVNLEFEIEEILGMNKKIKFNYTIIQEFLISLCCSRLIPHKFTLKYSVYKKLKEIVEKYLNIDFITQKIQEIDYLKNIFLNPQQVKAFKLFGKIEVSNSDQDHEKNNIFIEFQKKTEKEEIVALLNYYWRIDKRELIACKTLDAKIFNLLNEKLKKVILSERNLKFTD